MTQDAFKLLGFSSKEQQNIYKILAGILHLGNVQFESGSGKMDSESCSIPNSDESLTHFAELFDIELDQIRKWLCNRKIVTARESYVKPIGAGDVSKFFNNLHLENYNECCRKCMQFLKY